MIYFLLACLIGLSSCSRSSTNSTDYTADPACPYLDYLTYDYYPGNCSKFYECDHGKKFLLDCPDGLYWNTNYNYCDYLENVDCSRSTTTTRGTTEYSLDPTCPYLDRLTYDYYPGNCSKFYECDHGKKFLLDCPDGLYWNIKYNYCDYLENVDCSRGNAKTAATSTVDTGVTNQSTTDYTIDPTCPFSIQKTYEYDPANCSRVYLCERGKRYLLDCPDGLYWNTDTGYCDKPENVDCTRGHTITMSSTSATSIDDTDVRNETTTSVTVTTTAAVCQDDSDGTFVANPTDCSKFYECTGRLPVEFSCPAGTLWDKERKECDFPKNVDC